MTGGWIGELYMGEHALLQHRRGVYDDDDDDDAVVNASEEEEKVRIVSVDVRLADQVEVEMKMEMEMHDMVYVVCCMYVWTVRERTCGGLVGGVLCSVLYTCTLSFSLSFSFTHNSLSLGLCGIKMRDDEGMTRLDR